MSLLVMPLPIAPKGNFGWPVKQTPLFNTITQTPASGRGELRIPTMQFPRWDFVVDITYLTGDASTTGSPWQQLINFYIGVQGAASDWLFLHPYDHTIPGTSPQLIATCDGTTTAFTMFRTFISLGAMDIIQNFVSAPSIYLNGVLQVSGYTIDQYGTLTFSVAPGLGVQVSWSGQFYYRCHFLDDEWGDLQEDWFQYWSLNGLKFRSVIL